MYAKAIIDNPQNYAKDAGYKLEEWKNIGDPNVRTKMKFPSLYSSKKLSPFLFTGEVGLSLRKNDIKFILGNMDGVVPEYDTANIMTYIYSDELLMYSFYDTIGSPVCNSLVIFFPLNQLADFVTYCNNEYAKTGENTWHDSRYRIQIKIGTTKLTDGETGLISVIKY